MDLHHDAAHQQGTANYCNLKCNIQNGKFPDLHFENTTLDIWEKAMD